MRALKLIALILPLVVFQGVARGQTGGACDSKGVGCCDRCGQASCGCDARIQPPCPGNIPPQQAPPQQAPVPGQQGVFVAPPQNGTVLGAANSLHVQGMEIEFPALRLRMPSIRMPSMFRSRTNARMLIDQAEAPFIPANSVPTAMMPVAAAAPATPQSLTVTPDQLQRLIQQMEKPESAPVPPASPTPCTEASPAPCDSAQLERLRRLEAVERHLNQRIIEMESRLQELGDPTAGLVEAPTRLPGAGKVELRRIPAPSSQASAPIEPDHQVQRTVYERPVMRRLPSVSPLPEPRRLPPGY